jgi:hypothetical protein
MVDTDGELSILLNAFTKIKTALGQDKSSLAQNIMKGIIESEEIIKSKMGNAAPLGGSSVIGSKTKGLFEMFDLSGRVG